MHVSRMGPLSRSLVMVCCVVFCFCETTKKGRSIKAVYARDSSLEPSTRALLTPDLDRSAARQGRSKKRMSAGRVALRQQQPGGSSAFPACSCSGGVIMEEPSNSSTLGSDFKISVECAAAQPPRWRNAKNCVAGQSAFQSYKRLNQLRSAMRKSGERCCNTVHRATFAPTSTATSSTDTFDKPSEREPSKKKPRWRRTSRHGPLAHRKGSVAMPSQTANDSVDHNVRVVINADFAPGSPDDLKSESSSHENLSPLSALRSTLFLRLCRRRIRNWLAERARKRQLLQDSGPQAAPFRRNFKVAADETQAASSETSAARTMLAAAQKLNGARAVKELVDKGGDVNAQDAVSLMFA